MGLFDKFVLGVTLWSTNCYLYEPLFIHELFQHYILYPGVFFPLSLFQNFSHIFPLHLDDKLPTEDKFLISVTFIHLLSLYSIFSYPVY